MLGKNLNFEFPQGYYIEDASTVTICTDVCKYFKCKENVLQEVKEIYTRFFLIGVK